MSTTEMPSGRNRLPGMGASVAGETHEPAGGPATTAPAAVQPPRRRASARTTGRTGQPAAAPPGTAVAAPRESPVGGPYAGEIKMQVNPRIYPSIWRYYEELVDQLPRPQRRGALTALVNAALAQHAPHSPDEALDAIAWLRQAETRQQP